MAHDGPPRVIAFGECVWDTYAGRRHLAGAALNIAARAGALGAQAILVSAVGRDKDGNDLLKRIRALPCDAIIHRVGEPTPIINVTVDDAGQPRFAIPDACAFDSIPYPGAVRADAIAFGTLALRAETSRATLDRMLGQVPLRVFDANLRPILPAGTQRELLLAYVPQANVVKVNADEADVLERAFESGLQEIHERYGCGIYVTRGESGADYVGACGRIHEPAPLIDVKDTTGCGDAFAASVILGTLRQSPDRQILRDAVRYASTVASYEGALGDIERL